MTWHLDGTLCTAQVEATPHMLAGVAGGGGRSPRVRFKLVPAGGEDMDVPPDRRRSKAEARGRALTAASLSSRLIRIRRVP